MDTLMTITDVAEKMQLTEAAIRKFILQKTVPYIKIGGSIRFNPSEIEEWIKTYRNSKLRGAGERLTPLSQREKTI